MIAIIFKVNSPMVETSPRELIESRDIKVHVLEKPKTASAAYKCDCLG